MAKPVSMKDVAQAVRDAVAVTDAALPQNTEPQVRGPVTAEVLREFLDNEYVNDLPSPEDPLG